MWYQSKTVWVNLLGLVVVVGQYLTKTNMVDPEVVGGVLSVANVVLRFVSTQPLERSLN